MGREILFIGDSLTEFFDWQGRFPERGVCNLGISGETVEWLLERLPRIVSKHADVGAVFIMTGINNIAMETYGIIEPYREIIRQLRKAYPGAVIYVQSLLPAELPFIEAGEIERINGLLRGLADETKSTYLDLHELFVAHGVGRCLSPDGIHLSDEGYEVWARAVSPLVSAVR